MKLPDVSLGTVCRYLIGMVLALWFAHVFLQQKVPYTLNDAQRKLVAKLKQVQLNRTFERNWGFDFVT